MNDRLSKDKHEKQSISSQAPFYGGATHRGAIGKLNEDRYEFFRVGAGEINDWHASPDSSIYVAAVADGVTSKAAGADASTIAINAVGEALQDATTHMDISDLLENAFHAANLAIRKAVANNSALMGMSTTLVVAALIDNRLYLAHLGDSRAYLIRKGQIYRLTLDHTGVQMAVDSGMMTPEQARTHPNRHLILRHLAAEPSPAVDHQIILPGTDTGPETRQMVAHLDLAPNDMIMLCSDGVTDRIAESDIAHTMTTHLQQPEKATRRLVKHALDQGEPDNITAAAITIRGNRSLRAAMPFTAIELSLPKRLAIAVSLLLLVGVGMSWAAPSILEKWPDLATASIASSQQIDAQPTVMSQKSASAVASAAITANQSEPTTEILPSRSDNFVQPAAAHVLAPTVAGKQVAAAIPATSTSIPTAVPTATPTSVPTAVPTSTFTPAPTAVPTQVPAFVPFATPAVLTSISQNPQAGFSPPVAPIVLATATPSIVPVSTAAGPVQPAASIPIASVPIASAPIANVPIATAAPAQPAQAIASTESLIGNDWSITLISPIESTLKKRQRFQWQANFELPTAYLFELIIWPIGTTALQTGFSPSGASNQTDFTIDLQRFAINHPALLKHGEQYQWGVGIVETNDTTKRIFVFDNHQTFLFSFGNSNKPQSPEPSGEPDGEPNDGPDGEPNDEPDGEPNDESGE